MEVPLSRNDQGLDGPPAAAIRLAGTADLAQISRLYAHYVTHTTVTFDLKPPDWYAWSQRFWAIAETGLPFLVAELDEVVAGYALCVPWKSRPAYRQTVENSIYVAPWVTGRGVGTALMTHLLDACAAMDVREMIAVIVDTGEPASMQLHQKLDFTVAGRLRAVGFKHGRWLDTVLLQKTLR